MEPSVKKAKLDGDEEVPLSSSTVLRLFSAIWEPSPSSTLSRTSSDVAAPSSSSTLSRHLPSLPSSPPVDPRELLPAEIWQHILSFVPSEDILYAGRTCSLFYNFFARSPIPVDTFSVESVGLARIEDFMKVSYKRRHQDTFIEKHYQCRPADVMLKKERRSILCPSIRLGPSVINYYEWRPNVIDNRCFSLALLKPETVDLRFPVAPPPAWLGDHPHPPRRMTVQMHETPDFDVEGLRKWIKYCPPSIFHLCFPWLTHYEGLTLFPEEIYRAVLAIPEVQRMEEVKIIRFPDSIALAYEEIEPIKARSFELVGVTVERAMDLLQRRIMDWIDSVIVDEFAWTIRPDENAWPWLLYKNMFRFNEGYFVRMHGCVIILTVHLVEELMEEPPKILVLDEANPSRYLILSGCTLRTGLHDHDKEKELAMLEKYQRKHNIIV